MQADGLSGQLQSLCRNGFQMNWRSSLAMNDENVARLRDPELRVIDESCRPERKEKMMDKTIADSFPASDPPWSLPDPGEDSFGLEQEVLRDHHKTRIRRR
jgi:hypothetical protein